MVSNTSAENNRGPLGRSDAVYRAPSSFNRLERAGRSNQVAKRYEDPIEVATEEAGSDNAPLAFRWRGRQYFVDERLSSWREAGEWWQGTEEIRERHFFRVLAHPAGAGATGELDSNGFIVSNSSVYDIYRDRIKGEWRMARVWD